MPENDFDVAESRSVTRFVIDPPVAGSFGGVPVLIFDFAVRGVQAEHADPIRPGSSGRLSFAVPGGKLEISLRGKVVWSRLSQKVDFHGHTLYRTGFLIDDDVAASRSALTLLLDACVARPDDASLERKKKVLAEKKKMRDAKRMRVIPQRREIPGDQLLLVQHARERLKTNPDEAIKWYNRAKFSLQAAGQSLPYREDVLAVWEYLERSVDLETITYVLESEHH